MSGVYESGYRFLAAAVYDRGATALARPVLVNGKAGMSRAIRQLFTRRLHCSFCGKSEREVAKLVAGPNVFICDACVAMCVEVLDNGRPAGSPARTPGVLDRARGRLERFLRGTSHVIEVSK